MAWALQFDGVNEHGLLPVAFTATGDFTITTQFLYDDTTAFYLADLNGTNDGLYCYAGGIIRGFINGSASEVTLGSLVKGDVLNVIWSRLGTTMTLDVNGTSANTTNSSTLNLRRLASYQGSALWYEGQCRTLEMISVAESLHYNYSPTDSNHTSTVLDDIQSSNDINLFNTDASNWIDLGGGGNVDGTISITMSLFTSAGSGNIGESVIGGASELMDDLLISGAGVVGDNPTGTVNVTMGDISPNATGNIGEAITGALLITMSDINITSTGNVGEAVTGSVAAQAEDLLIYGEGTFALAVTGTANIQMEDFVIYGRESQEGGIYGAISAMPIEAEEINAIPIEVITK